MKKVALVTGGAAGIGRAIALRLARDGIAVGVLDLIESDAGKVADEIEATGGRGHRAGRQYFPPRDGRSRRQCFARGGRACDHPRQQCWNIGLCPLPRNDRRSVGPDHDGQPERHLYRHPDRSARHDRGRLGSIFNISSSSAQSGSKLMAHYSASKGGIVALTRTLAVEFGPCGVTCNAVAPRFVMNTVKAEADFGPGGVFDDETRDKMIALGPIRRQGEPEDIAGTCAWLVSDEAGYLTGQLIGVNGGRYI